MGPRFRGDDGVYDFHLCGWAAGASTLGVSGQNELPTISPLRHMVRNIHNAHSS
jgi:hypothetical protein